MSRSNRRMILPERVFGRSPAQITRLGRANLPIRAATWLLTHHKALLDARAKEVAAERGRVAAALRGLGVHVFDSEANLLMVKLPNATTVWQGLAARGVLVRNFDRPGPLAGCLRITIGTPQENDLLIDALTSLSASRST